MFTATKRVIALAPFFCASGLLAQTTIPSIPLQKFQDSLGINIHIEYTDGEYANANQVLTDLRYIGIHNVRDGVPNSNWLPQGQGLAALEMLASNGIKFDFVADCNSYTVPQMMTQLDSLESQYPGIALSVEGANEINNFPCNVGGGSNQQNATNWQQQVYSAVHGDSRLQGVPVLYMTGAPNVTSLNGLADIENTHPYVYQGEQPFARIQQDFNSYFAGLTYPRQITETGYSTLLSGDPDGVDPLIQAAHTFNLYFDSALQGNQRTYIYQLLQAYPNIDSDPYFGIFNYDGSPKALAQALHNLTTAIPADAPSAQKTVQATLNGLPSTAHTLAVTAADGTIYLWSWNEVQDWNTSQQSIVWNSTPFYTASIPGNWNVTYFSPASNQPIADPYTDSSGAHYGILYDFPTAIVFHPAN